MQSDLLETVSLGQFLLREHLPNGISIVGYAQLPAKEAREPMGQSLEAGSLGTHLWEGTCPPAVGHPTDLTPTPCPLFLCRVCV